MGHLATLNFSLGEDIDMLRDTIKRFATDEIAPRAAAIDEANLFPHREAIARECGQIPYKSAFFASCLKPSSCGQGIVDANS
jgi:hypothetical protein